MMMDIIRKAFVQFLTSYHVCVIFLTFAGIKANQQMGSCDWKKSGLSHSADSRVVERVQLNCESGSFEWMYPTTAVQIEFEFPYSTTDFTACFLPGLEFSGASLYYQGNGPESDDNSYQSSGMNLIFGDPDVKERSRERTEHDINEIACVNSTDGKLTMFLLATLARKDISRKIASFKYELIQRSHRKGRPEHKRHHSKLHKEKRILFTGSAEECRPCTSEELLNFYCSADFIAVGHVLSVADDENYKWTNIEFLTDHMIKATPSDWPVFESLSVISGFNLSRVPQTQGGSVRLSQKEIRHLQRGFFHVPAQCGFHMPKRSSRNNIVDPRLESDDRGHILMGNFNFGGVWAECLPRRQDMLALAKRHLETKKSFRKSNSVDRCNLEALTRTIVDTTL